MLLFFHPSHYSSSLALSISREIFLDGSCQLSISCENDVISKAIAISLVLLLNNRYLIGTAIVSSKRLPQTTAHVRITHLSWQRGFLAGEVTAAEYEWQFQWCFRQGQLSVTPSLGRALIQEPLGRFLEQKDYQLEPGGDYAFTIRAEL